MHHVHHQWHQSWPLPTYLQTHRQLPCLPLILLHFQIKPLQLSIQQPKTLLILQRQTKLQQNSKNHNKTILLLQLTQLSVIAPVQTIKPTLHQMLHQVSQIRLATLLQTINLIAQVRKIAQTVQ